MIVNLINGPNSVDTREIDIGVWRELAKIWSKIIKHRARLLVANHVAVGHDSVYRRNKDVGLGQLREREKRIFILLWLQVCVTGPRHHLASSLRNRAQGTR